MSATMSSSAPETRTEPRQRALKAAKIVLNHEHSTIDCLIRNRAGHGAKLELKAVFVVPEFFEILIDSDQVIAPARRVWQIGEKMGVEFIEPFRAVHPKEIRGRVPRN